MNNSNTVQCSKGQYRSVKFRGVETPHHGVTFVTREATSPGPVALSDGMMR